MQNKYSYFVVQTKEASLVQSVTELQNLLTKYTSRTPDAPNALHEFKVFKIEKDEVASTVNGGVAKNYVYTVTFEKTLKQ